MAELPYIYYIDPPDTLEKVREKIRKTKKEKIILVLPEENRNLKNIKALTILKKEAQTQGKKISIFSSDPQYRSLAEDCGIEIEESLIGGAFPAKGELSFRPKLQDILPKREIIKEKIPKKEEEKKEEKEEKETFGVKSFSKKRISILTGSILGIIFLSLLTFFGVKFLPRAKIIVIPLSQEIEFSGSFLVKKDAKFSLEEEIVPGEIIEKKKEETKKFFSSGKEMREEKARGFITIYSEDSYSHRFVPYTRFKSEDGKIFRSQDWVYIPPGSKENPSKVKIEVVADEPGEEYNIGPSKFTIPGLLGTGLYEKIYAISEEPMKGGFIGEAKVVTKEDVERAKKELKEMEESLKEKVKKEIQSELSPNLAFLLDKTAFETKIEIDKKPGDIGETFSGKIEVKGKILGFSEDYVKEIVAKEISEEIKEGIEYETVASSLVLNYEISRLDLKEGEMEVNFSGKIKIALKIEKEKLKNDILGMDRETFSNYIKKNWQDKIYDTTVILRPFFVKRIPKNPDQITIEIQYK